jgi:phosphoserine phosphatase
MKRFFFGRRKGLTEASTPADPNRTTGLLTGDPEQDRQSIEILLESIAEVTSNIDLDRLLQDIVARSVEVSQAERGILLLGSQPDNMEVRTARDNKGTHIATDVDYSRSVVKRSVTERRAGQYQVQSSQEALELGQSVFDLKLRTVMCAPLEAQGRLIGVIYVDSKAARREFSPRDLALFEALSSQLAIALENARLHADSLEKVRLEKDVEIARRIQEHLLPPLPGDCEGLDVALRFSPASQASGDTYDFVALGGGRLAVLIGDVTGHGVGAALLTHAAQAAIRSYLELVPDVGEVMTRLNNRLVAGVETGVFMSVVLLVMDLPNRTLTYVNAGHAPILLVRSDKVEELEKTGMVLGVVEDQEYTVRGPIQLEPGDCVFIRTDGVEETMNAYREVFGEDRMKEILLASRDSTASDALDKLDTALTEHAAGQPQEDDVTMITLKVQG